MENNSRNLLRLLVVAVMVCFAFSVAAYAQYVVEPYGMPVIVNGTASFSACENSPGPWVTLDGNLLYSGLAADVIFQNNEKGTHTNVQPTVVEVKLVDFTDKITIPKQPVNGGVGGNPWIWIQFFQDENLNKPLTDPIYLGRCVQGVVDVNPSFLTAVLAAVSFAASDCSNSPGPQISLWGTLTFKGVYAAFIFSNQRYPDGQHNTMRSSPIEIVTDGNAITIPKQPILGGVGGNPFIYVQFKQLPSGATIGDPIYVGRCVQLSH